MKPLTASDKEEELRGMGAGPRPVAEVMSGVVSGDDLPTMPEASTPEQGTSGIDPV